MGRRGGGDVVHVDLVEGDEATVPPPEAAADRARRTRRLRVAGVLVLLVLAAVIVGAEVVERRREAALLVSLQGVPGFMDPFDGPIAEVWREPAGWAVFDTEQVVVLESDDGTRMTAIDPESGTILWSRDVPPGMSCEPFGEDTVAATLWDRIACARARGGLDGEAPGSLLVLDALKGTVIESRDLSATALFVYPYDGDLIIATEGAESRLELRRSDLASDREVWSYSSEPGLRDALVSDGDGFWGYWVEGGVLVIQSASVTLALDVTTGEEAAPPPDQQDPFVRTWELPDGGRVEMTYDPSLQASVRNSDGSLRYGLGGSPWIPWITDRSVPGILTILDGLSVIGLDAATGDPVWEAEGLGGADPLVQVDGVLVAQGGWRSVFALDASTGAKLWEVEASPAVSLPPLTDGRVVILAAREDGAGYLAARDLRTGAVAWRVPVPGGARYAQVLGRSTILLHTDTEVIAYR